MPILDPAHLGQLASQAQSGDANALEELLTQLHPKLYNTAFRLTGNAADAEDLTQDTCIKLLDNLPQLRDPMAVLSWVETTVKHACFNHLKRKRPDLFRDDEKAQAALDDLSEEQTDAVPDRYMDMYAKREIILAMIDSLPEAQRLTIYLYYYSGNSVQEIAQLMEVSEGTVKSRLSAARSAIKLQVEEEERKGNKLYVIFPFLGRLLQEDAQNTQPPVPLPVTSAQIATCAQQCAAVLAAGGAAKAASTGGAKSGAQGGGKAKADTAGKSAAEGAAKSAGKSAAAKGGAGLAGKVIAGVVVVALLAGAALILPGLLQGGEVNPGGATESTAPSPEATAEVTAEPTPEPTPEPTLNLTDFDPEAMIGQPLSALTAIAGEPNEQTDPIRPRWVSDMDYDFTVTLADDGETIRELFVLYGPSVLGLNAGDSADAARDALSALGGPGGVNTMDSGYGQTSYSAINADSSRLYQFDCVNGAVLMRSIHDLR